MKKIYVLILLAFCTVFLTACDDAKNPVTFFDGQVIAQRVRVNSFANDRVTFIFTEKGQYDIAFFSIEGSSVDLLPNLTVIVTETPYIKTVYQFSINAQRVAITRNGVTESQNLP